MILIGRIRINYRWFIKENWHGKLLIVSKKVEDLIDKEFDSVNLILSGGNENWKTWFKSDKSKYGGKVMDALNGLKPEGKFNSR